MALPYRPHALRYVPPSDGLNDDRIQRVPSWDGSGIEFRGQITPGAFALVVERFGVELAKPMLLLCDREIGAVVQVGGMVWHGERAYVVKAPPALWDAVSPTFAEIAIEEVDHA